MIFIYVLLNIILYYISKDVFKQKINPITLYSLPWFLSLMAYEMKLVKFYDLNLLTWIVIISFQLAYSLGSILGQARFRKSSQIYNISGEYRINEVYEMSKMEKKVKKVILLLSIISAIAVIPNFLGLINQYGFNVLSATNQIYHDRLTGGRNFQLIPYLGSVTQISVILSGIYISRYGAKLFLLIPISLMILNMLPTGGRTDFVFGLFFLGLPLLLNRKKKLNLSKKNKVLISLFILFFIFFFVVITKNRSSWIQINQYMSPLMIRLVSIQPSVYKIYNYIAGPIGALNVYLLDPVYNFGTNSLGMFISFLNKFGADLYYQRYQEFYNIPLPFNVGTYIRELIQDFQYIGGIVVIFLFGFLFGRSFDKFRRFRTFSSEIFVLIFSAVIFMSFFVWFYRETVFWISTFLGLPIGYYLDRYYFKLIKNGKHEKNRTNTRRM